MPKNEKEL